MKLTPLILVACATPTTAAVQQPVVVTDLQAQLNAGGIVHIPAGRYVLPRAGLSYHALTVPAGVTLIGEGRDGTILQLAPGTAPSVRLLEVVGDGVTVQSLTLDGDRAEQDILADGSHGKPDEHRAGIFARGAGLTVRDVMARDFSGDGVYLYGTASNATIDQLVTQGNGRNGMTTVAASGLLVTGSTFQGNAAQQFDSEPGSPGHVDNVRITGSTFDGLGSSNDYVLTICGSAGGQSTGWEVTGNTINGGVYVVWASDVHLAGNTGLDPTSKPSLTAYRKVERLNVEGNAFTALAAEYGIAITGTGTGQAPAEVRIAGDTLTLGAGRYGIGISGALSVTLEGNVLQHPAGTGEAAITARATNPAVPMVSVTLRGNRATGFSRGLGVGGMVENPAATISGLIASGNSLGGPWYLDEGSGALQAATLTDNADAVTRWPAGAVVVTRSTTTMTRSP